MNSKVAVSLFLHRFAQHMPTLIILTYIPISCEIEIEKIKTRILS